MSSLLVLKTWGHHSQLYRLDASILAILLDIATKSLTHRQARTLALSLCDMLIIALLRTMILMIAGDSEA